jgi:hypothetical protein
MALPEVEAAGRAADLCSSVSGQPSPLVALACPRARSARLPPLTHLPCTGAIVLRLWTRGGTRSITCGQNIVMHHLGVIGKDIAADANAFEEYLYLFATGLSDSHC